MKIVPAKINSAKEIAEIEHNNGYYWSKYSLEKEVELAKKLLTEGKEKVFLAKENDKFVGYISMRIEKNIGEIGMSVLKNYQGKGIGSKLMMYIIRFAKKNHCVKIKLAVWENNLKAINLYKKFGFIIKSVKKRFYENGDSLLHMNLNLSN